MYWGVIEITTQYYDLAFALGIVDRVMETVIAYRNNY